MNLKATDGPILVSIRATYVIQLLVTIASRTSNNLKPMFDVLASNPTASQFLSDMDSCLLSCESMNTCWCAALTDILARGMFDLKHVLQEGNVAAVTSVGIKLGLAAVADTKAEETDKTEPDNSENTAIFTWQEMMSFGSSEHVPSADDMVRLQLFLYSELIAHAKRTENPYRGKMCVYVEQQQRSDGPAKRRGHNMLGNKTTVLFQLDDSADLLRSAKDEKLLFCKLPTDFKLVFFGSVSFLAAFVFQKMLCTKCKLNIFIFISSNTTKKSMMEFIYFRYLIPFVMLSRNST